MADIKKLQNGSDIRGIACEGVEGEHVNLTEDAGNRRSFGLASVMIHALRRTVCLRQRQRALRRQVQRSMHADWYRRLRCL